MVGKPCRNIFDGHLDLSSCECSCQTHRELGCELNKTCRQKHQRRATARENDESMWQRGGGARGHHKASSTGSQKGRSGSPMAGNHLQRQGVGPRYATTKRQRIQREPPLAHTLHFCDSRCHLRNVGRRAVLAVRLHETAPVGPTAQTRRQICDRRPRRRMFCTSASFPNALQRV